MKITVRELKQLIREAAKSREMTPERRKQREDRYRELQKLDKRELIAKLGRTSRINSVTMQTPKSDIITAIVDDEL
jgi:hypothetical protein